MLISSSLVQVSEEWDPKFTVAFSNCKLLFAFIKCPNSMKDALVEFFILPYDGRSTCKYHSRYQCSDNGIVNVEYLFPDKCRCSTMYIFNISMAPSGTTCDRLCSNYLSFGPFHMGKDNCSNTNWRCGDNKSIPRGNHCCSPRNHRAISYQITLTIGLSFMCFLFIALAFYKVLSRLYCKSVQYDIGVWP